MAVEYLVFTYKTVEMQFLAGGFAPLLPLPGRCPWTLMGA